MKRIIVLVFLSLLMTSCTTPMVTGRDVETEPISKTFNVPAIDAFEAAGEALRAMDYKVEYENKDEGVLRTGWQPTKVDSHYLDLFDRPDYGATGSYYYMIVHIKSEGPNVSTVEISAPLRTIVSRMKSSHREEKKFLARVETLLLPGDMEVTNIGVVKPGVYPVHNQKK